MRRLLLAAMLALLAAASWAKQAAPAAADPALEARMVEITSELRCLVCQNQNIADSDAGLAKDLRNEVFEMMRAGKSDDEIRQFLVDRYGDFVLYDPPFKASTLVLWVGPLVVLIIGFAVARNMMLRGGPHPDLPGPIDDKVDR